MAAKTGTITGSFAVTWLTPSLRWTVTSRSTGGGYTLKVEAIVTVTGSGVYTDRNAKWTLVVDGQTLVNEESIRLAFDASTPYPVGTTKVFISKTITLNANTNGSRSVAMSLTIVPSSGGASGDGSVSGTAELIPFFWWRDSYNNDANLIAAGKPTTNITAAKWNTFNSMIKTYVNSSYTYTSATSGGVMTKAMIQAAANQLGVTIQSDNVVRASYFIALRNALNTA